MATYTLHEAYQRVEGLLDKVSDQAKEIMQGHIANGTSSQATGRLRDSINVVPVSESARSVGTDLDYAKFVNGGRGDVYPVKAKALRWYDPRQSSNAVFAQHAGPMEGIHFIRKTKESLDGLQISL